MKYFISALCATLLLSACSNTRQYPQSRGLQPSLAESFAYERAASIAQVVPMKLGRFLLTDAKASQSTVYLSLRALNVHDTNFQSLVSEINAIGYGLCQDKKTTLVIQQGVSYHLFVFNAEKQKLGDALVNVANCSTKGFIIPNTTIAQPALVSQ